MPRKSTPTLSRRRLECFTRDKLFSEIHSITEIPPPNDSWGSILSQHLTGSILDDLSNLQTHLENVTNDALIDCALALRSALESTIMAPRGRKRRPGCAIQMTTGEDLLRARMRRLQGRSKAHHSSSWKVVRRKASDDNSTGRLQDTQDLFADYRRGIESQRDVLAAQRDELAAQRDELAAQIDKPAATLRTIEEENSRKDKVIKDLNDQLQSTSLNTSDGFCEDTSTSWTGGVITGGVNEAWPAPSAVDRLMCLSWGPMSEDDQFIQGDEVPQYHSWTTDVSESEGGQFSAASQVLFPPRCCDRMPVALTNEGCELCQIHCELFTWVSTAEMGMGPYVGLTPCPACNGPGCKWVQLSGNLTN
ncbi:hypothetical protein AYL99_12016 [Fonsecaea erecta]|uniref:Uncharacterized protein n=1 Tax=Fonsecaea erecta TaxID=1367422 RepID=A0A178Z277_9EURO|nr:hypothetical protein AYL99_12016 [Fonsecaea erecta]OAP53797.1 hypothetical protein AYL99_12016 [Fonsecaea erecta]